MPFAPDVASQRTGPRISKRYITKVGFKYINVTAKALSNKAKRSCIGLLLLALGFFVLVDLHIRQNSQQVLHLRIPIELLGSAIL